MRITEDSTRCERKRCQRKVFRSKSASVKNILQITVFAISLMAYAIAKIEQKQSALIMEIPERGLLAINKNLSMSVAEAPTFMSTKENHKLINQYLRDEHGEVHERKNNSQKSDSVLNARVLVATKKVNDNVNNTGEQSSLRCRMSDSQLYDKQRNGAKRRKYPSGHRGMARQRFNEKSNILSYTRTPMIGKLKRLSKNFVDGSETTSTNALMVRQQQHKLFNRNGSYQWQQQHQIYNFPAVQYQHSTTISSLISNISSINRFNYQQIQQKYKLHHHNGKRLRINNLSMGNGFHNNSSDSRKHLQISYDNEFLDGYHIFLKRPSALSSSSKNSPIRKISLTTAMITTTAPPSQTLRDPNKDDHILMQGNGELYSNVGALFPHCPPAIRLVTPRVVTPSALLVSSSSIGFHYPKSYRPSECQCSAIGSLANSCNRRTGQCQCLDHVAGKRCDKCKAGYWNLTEKIGCDDCQCDPFGSRGHECNPWTGQCDCKIGVGGRRCDECTDGFFGFSNEGCQRCVSCSGEGQVCDALNGRCVCPPYSRGFGCMQCLPGTWGWQPRLGCRQCQCDRIGSIGYLCNIANGQCQCREGYAGRRCEACAVGYFGYPECRRCNCDVDGSFKRSDGLIACDANGQCPCKSLVVGLKCDTCMQATFGLSSLNPEGCTRCYCFGRSQECEQTDWSWGYVRMGEARNLSIEYLKMQHINNVEFEFIKTIKKNEALVAHEEDAHIQNFNGLNVIPNYSGNVSIGSYLPLFHPLYFQLAENFHGDQTKSYGSYLHFSLITDGASIPIERKIITHYPLVRIHSHSELVVDFYEFDGLEYSRNISYHVPLHESFWKIKKTGLIADRATLMVALQNIKHIFLRSSTFADFNQIMLHNVYMNSAVFLSGTTNMIAKSVEQCRCPERYTGLSCQNPAEGYYRWHNITETSTDYSVEEIIGRAVPCQCNGRSSTCNPETGFCLNCANNTSGRHCEQCAEGFYGDPLTSVGCRSCPCPRVSRNFARGCTVWQNEVSCVCRPGYSGRLCDRCRQGYFGDPLAAINGTCESCNCHLHGITKDGCEPSTGQCFCKEGVTGLKCDICTNKHYHLKESGCKICDNCTLLLFDYADVIDHKLRRGVHHIDITSIPAPILKVYEYESDFNSLHSRFNDFKKAENLLVHYNEEEFFQLQANSKDQHLRSNTAIAIASKHADGAAALLHDGTLFYIDVQILKAKIVESIQRLDDYGTESYHVNLPSALEEALFYLSAIQKDIESLSQLRNNFTCDWSIYYTIDNFTEGVNARRSQVDILRNYLNETNGRLLDLRLHIDRTIEMQRDIDGIIGGIQQHAKHLRSAFHQIQSLLGNFEGKLFSRNIIAQTDVINKMNVDSLEQLSGQIVSLSKLRNVLNQTFVEYHNIHRETHKHWLPKSEKHAMHLLDRFNEVARQFEPTRNDARIAMLASSAYKNISDAIEEANRAAHEATNQVNGAHYMLYLEQSTPVIEKAQLSFKKSRQLKESAMLKMKSTEALIELLQDHEIKVKNIKSRIMEVGIRANNISINLQSLQRNTVRNSIVENLEEINQIRSSLNAISNKTNAIRVDILHLVKNFKVLEPDWEIKLSMAEENISSTKNNIRLANTSLAYVEEQSLKKQTEFNLWNNSIFMQLLQLKNQIAQAKHGSETIRIPLQSKEIGSRCVRSYRPVSYGLSTHNNIKFTFALSHSSRTGNSPLIYLQGSDGRYIAVDLFNNHVRFLWNFGDTTSIITHPLEIQARDVKYSDSWYLVECNRTLNMGELSVRRFNSRYGSMANTNFTTLHRSVSGHSAPEYSRFLQTSAQRNYLGGYPPINRTINPQINAGLNVILDNIQIDGSYLGIWNFESSEGNCKGAMKVVPEIYSSSSSVRYFNGFGYAVVKKLRPRPYRRNLFALQMSFKTLDENALLFLTIDEKNNRSVSVNLREGRLVFSTEYSSDIHLLIKTSEKYNTGKWVKIEAAREFAPKRDKENGILRINGNQPITGSPNKPIKSQMLPDLSKSVYYLGGMPPGLRATGVAGETPPFLGCLMDVQINGETYDPLESSSYFGVDSMCRETVRKAGFNGDGYLTLGGHSLRKRANIAFVFRTLQPQCLLLLAGYPLNGSQRHQNDASEKIMGNFSIALLEGKLEIWMNSGRGRLRLLSRNTLNDGEYHAVKIIKIGRKFDLIVDDDLQDSQTLSGTITFIHISEEDGARIYVGGSSPLNKFNGILPTMVKLEGAIRDLIINNHTINFNAALDSYRVQVGRDGPLMDDTNISMEIPLQTEPIIHSKNFSSTTIKSCETVDNMTYESNTFKFGDMTYSYAQTQGPMRNYWQRNFHISFDFRTFYPNGLILLAPGIRDKNKHYVALILKDGHLLLIVRGRRREELPLHAKLNDGSWHHVTVQCQERKVTMSVEIGRTDQKTSAQMKFPKKILASSKFYVGGLPEMPPKIPGELLIRLEAFKGCLRRFNINNVTQKLTHSGNHSHVGQCMANVERGSQFNGEAYAIYKKSFQVGKYLELQVDFKTAEASGILISVSEPTGFPALSLELANGIIVLSCDLGDGNPFRVESRISDSDSSTSRTDTCDNNWHNISALYDDVQVSLRVDHQTAVVAIAPQRTIGKIQTNSPLYIGGIPDIAPSGTLLTRENFKGCIRNVSVRNERRDWINMDYLHNVYLGECSIQTNSNS